MQKQPTFLFVFNIYMPVLRNRSRSPRSRQQNNPPARGRGRGRGRGYTPSNYSGEVSSNTRQPRSHGTGAPRGRGNSPRGRANSRSRPAQSRARSDSNDRVLQFERTNDMSRFGNVDRRQRATTNQPRATTSQQDNLHCVLWTDMARRQVRFCWTRKGSWTWQFR